MKSLPNSDKKKFFGKRRITEILKDKERIKIGTCIVDTIDRLGNDQYIELGKGLVPLVDENGYRLYGDWHNFLKRGPILTLRSYTSREQANFFASQFYLERFEKFDSVKRLNNDLENILQSGYGWRGLRDKRSRRVHLVDCIQGAKLFSFCENNSNDRYKIDVEPYDKAGKIEDRGGIYIVSVPSRTSRKKYDIVLRNIPLNGNDNNYANIRDIDHNHDCGIIKDEVTTFRDVSMPIIFCPHVVAAYHKVAKYCFNSGNKEVMKLNPIAVPSQKTVNYDQKLESNVVVRIPGIPRRRLNKADKEILLWRYIGKFGNPLRGKDKTFYASDKKVQDYDW